MTTPRFHLQMAKSEDLIDEIQKRGMTVTPGGNERAKGEIVVRSDDESSAVTKNTLDVLGQNLSIAEWQEIIHGWAVGKGWWDDPNPNIPEKLMLMVTEVAEAMEDYRNGLSIQEMTFQPPDNKPCGFPSELADVVIRILDFCGHFRIDLESAMIVKHQYNETRAHKHGGKRC